MGESGSGFLSGALGSKPLRSGLLEAMFTVNAYRPVADDPLMTTGSFFASWITSEAAPGLLALRLGRAARRFATGNRSGWDYLGYGLTAASAVGLANLVREGRMAEEQFHSALVEHLPGEFLEERPVSARLGGGLGLMLGTGRTRHTRRVVFHELGRKGLALDVYEPYREPESGARRPAVLQIHGGAWVGGSRRDQGVPLLNHLAAHGWVGFNVDYRLSPRVKAPEHLIDCKRALAWIREHADEYNVDPDFVVVTGGSAGGHLCALVALTANDPTFQPGFEEADTSVQAAVPFYGVYDLRDGGYRRPNQVIRLLETVMMGVPIDHELWKLYSPIERIHADAPPMLIVHGDRDVLVPVAGARRFARALREVSNNEVVYVELQGAQHAFEVFPSPRSVRTIEFVERFLTHRFQQHLAAEGIERDAVGSGRP